MSQTTNEQRAIQVLKANRYFALSTIDHDGPWAACLAYTAMEPRHLFFFSEISSRHALAVDANPKVAGVIYDSTCTPDTAESIQFSGVARVYRDVDTIRSILAKNASGQVDEVELRRLSSDSATRLFGIEVLEAFVLDQELYQRTGRDGRISFEFETALRHSLDPQG